MKTLAFAAALLTAAAVLPASAQVVTVVPLDNATVVQPFGVTVRELESKAITDAQGNRLGDVERVIGTAQQGPTALVIDAENSESHFIVPLERFRSVNGTIRVDVTAAELAALPVYTDR